MALNNKKGINMITSEIYKEYIVGFDGKLLLQIYTKSYTDTIGYLLELAQELQNDLPDILADDINVVYYAGDWRRRIFGLECFINDTEKHRSILTDKAYFRWENKQFREENYLYEKGLGINYKTETLPDIIKEVIQAEREQIKTQRYVIARANTHNNLLLHITRLGVELMSDFPELNFWKMNVKLYAGERYRQTFGVEARVDADLYSFEDYTEIEEVEYTF